LSRPFVLSYIDTFVKQTFYFLTVKTTSKFGIKKSLLYASKDFKFIYKIAPTSG
jgi:hypothetical protein